MHHQTTQYATMAGTAIGLVCLINGNLACAQGVPPQASPPAEGKPYPAAVRASAASHLQTDHISLNVNHKPLLDVVQQILDGGRISYVFAAKLPSPVLTANFHNVSRAAAIASLFKASGSPLTYRVENDVCFIDFAREERVADLNSTPTDERRVSVDAVEGALSGILEKMLRQAGASYIIDPALDTMTVTAQLGDVPLNQAIRALTHSTSKRIMVHMEIGNVYHFEVVPTTTDTSLRR